MQQVWVGAALLAVGLVFCFFGHRIARVALALGGAALGYVCGLVIYVGLENLVGTPTAKAIPSWAVGVVMAVLFAGAAYAFYVGGVLLLLGSIGFGLGEVVVGWLNIPAGWQIGVSVILALVLAGLGIAADIPRNLMIIGTALLGGVLAVTAVQQLTGQRISWLNTVSWGADLQPHLIWLGILVVLAVAGSAVQWRQHGAASLRASYPN
jgi:hypothetical protein